ncbi:RagB/SusD family nutrient uptake outer membrane protein [Maribellus luteus]|uniref:RagB/SusD family nutrient uptake outer membrane protein n=1 Tax=Maribellus luteus TaxID=2305463 RepID=A0A399T6A7_9BACT|nr:RagB/SusD family nutrient uptake outer membrane protein [Maribellus luteus]RIJ50405.1 RagB/SusD family nutrient uptake outer membrane protein [Maribellus luteus]
MKKLNYILFSVLLFFVAVSCDEDALLTEIPKDFQTPENSFTTKEGFEAGMASLHSTMHSSIFGSSDQWQKFVHFGQDVDLAVSGLGEDALWYSIRWNTMTPDDETVLGWWRTYYSLIFRANTIINRADDPVVFWNSEEEKNEIVGEAKFIRAFAYHFLANMWGGVPITLEETAGARFDYVRSTQSEVYEQCVEDLTFATQWMKTVDKIKGGQIPRGAAYHLLSEVYIAMGKYSEAVTAASGVIDDPNYELMTERFGKYKDFTFYGYDYQGEQEPWGDVYWDLFRDGNFHRSQGNKEAIWNTNLVYLGEGSGYPLTFERWWGPYCWGAKAPDGVQNLLMDSLMGRPVGVIRPTKYASEDIWNFKDSKDTDIRNSKYNIQRDFYWNNPASDHYGQLVKKEDYIDQGSSYFRSIYPYFMKFVQAVHYGQEVDKTSGQKHDNGRTWKDVYLMRVAETYLLRAEAHHLNGRNELAAADINVVRSRANANPVDAADVDLDLILDERARELYGEEFRVNTLLRMGKLKEYLRKYHHATQVQNLTYPDGGFLELLPIPQREIEANKDAVLEQNPGYE